MKDRLPALLKLSTLDGPICLAANVLETVEDVVEQYEAIRAMEGR